MMSEDNEEVYTRLKVQRLCGDLAVDTVTMSEDEGVYKSF